MSEQNLSRTKRSSQAIDNFSFDEDFLVKVTELVRRNEAGTAIEYFSPATEEKQDSLLLVKNPGQTLYDKDSTGLLYKGYNASPDAAQSATDWLIIKYVKTSGSLVQKITRTGSWTGRVALF